MTRLNTIKNMREDDDCCCKIECDVNSDDSKSSHYETIYFDDDVSEDVVTPKDVIYGFFKLLIIIFANIVLAALFAMILKMIDIFIVKMI